MIQFAVIRHGCSQCPCLWRPDPHGFRSPRGLREVVTRRHPPLQVPDICKHCLCSVELFPNFNILVPNQLPGASRDRWLILTRYLNCHSDPSFLRLWPSPLMSASPLDDLLSTLISFSFLYPLGLFPRTSLMLLESFARTAWGVLPCGSSLYVEKETSLYSNEDTYQLGPCEPFTGVWYTWDLPPQTSLFYFQAPTVRTQQLVWSDVPIPVCLGFPCWLRW